MSVDWDKRQGTLGKHKHLSTDVLDEATMGTYSGGGGITVSATDPGAVGARSLWLRLDVSSGRILGFFIRSEANTQWNEAAFGSRSGTAADARVMDPVDVSLIGAQIALSAPTPGGTGTAVLAIHKQDANNYEGAMVVLGEAGVSQIALRVQNTTTGALLAGITIDSGGIKLPSLPTSSPGAGYLWNDAGIVKVGT